MGHRSAEDRDMAAASCSVIDAWSEQNIWILSGALIIPIDRLGALWWTIRVNKETFLTSASDLTREGIDAYANGSASVAIANLATALEHLAKAFLVSYNPAYIAANNDFRSMLTLAGHPGGRPEADVRTISCDVACERIQLILPAFPHRSLRSLIGARNGFIHGAQQNDVSLDQVLGTFLEGADYVLQEMDEDRAEFYSTRRMELVTSLRLSATDEVSRSVQKRILQARNHLSERVRGLDPAAQQQVARALISPLMSIFPTATRCPACSNSTMYGGFGLAESDAVTIVAEHIPEAEQTFTVYPHRLKCDVCKLILNGELELRAAGVPTSWQATWNTAEWFEKLMGLLVDRKITINGKSADEWLGQGDIADNTPVAEEPQ
jgi:hypothetical protein